MAAVSGTRGYERGEDNGVHGEQVKVSIAQGSLHLGQRDTVAERQRFIVPCTKGG